jgi:hypothetical protein
VPVRFELTRDFSSGFADRPFQPLRQGTVIIELPLRIELSLFGVTNPVHHHLCVGSSFTFSYFVRKSARGDQGDRTLCSYPHPMLSRHGLSPFSINLRLAEVTGFEPATRKTSDDFQDRLTTSCPHLQFVFPLFQ